MILVVPRNRVPVPPSDERVSDAVKTTSTNDRVAVGRVRRDRVHTDHRPWRRNLGDLDGLVADITQRGMISPPAVVSRSDGDWDLLAGSRRWAASGIAWPSRTSVVFIRGWADFAAWMRRDTDLSRTTSAQHQLPLNWYERLDFYERVRDLVHHGRGDFVECNVAAYLDVDENHLRRMRLVWRLANDPTENAHIRTVAEKAFVDVNAGRVTPNMAYNRIRRIRDSDVFATSSLTGSDQRRMMTRLLAQLAGTAQGIDTFGTVSPGVTTDEVTEWLNGLTTARRRVDRFIRQLRTWQNRQSDETKIRSDEGDE
jgi:ParB-like nuclease domain